MIEQSKINERLPDMTQNNMSVDVSVSVLQYKMVGLGLWCLTPLSTIFQLYRGSQFYWWRKPEYLEKITEKKQQQKLIQQRSNFIYIVIYLINKNIYILVLVHLVQIDIEN